MSGRIDYGYETWSEKFKRKINENPWVPIGCAATTGALVMSAIKMKAGKSKDMQYWLRARVGLQGLTLVALIAGSMALQASRNNTAPVSGSESELPRNEATTELLREQKREKEKSEFEERLKAAEMAHKEELAAGSRILEASESSGSAAGSTEGSKSGHSWTRWFRRGSSKRDQDESNKK